MKTTFVNRENTNKKVFETANNILQREEEAREERNREGGNKGNKGRKKENTKIIPFRDSYLKFKINLFYT